MTKKAKTKQKAHDEKRKQSDMMKDEDVKEINRNFRSGTLWEKKK